MIRNLAIMIGTFAIATGLAELLGAANLGVAISFGQIAFIAATIWLMVAADASRVDGDADRD